MISFKCKLQLKFRNKNDSSMILNFHTVWNKTICYHKTKIYEELIYHEKRTTHWYTVTSLLLKTLKQCLINITSFSLLRSHYSQSILFKYTNDLDSVCPNCFDCRI
jgi:hypothetical protein